MAALEAFALGTLGMAPEAFLWSTWRELNAMVRGYERRHRDAWERTILLFNTQVEQKGRLTYEKLFGLPQTIAEASEAEVERRQKRRAEAEQFLRATFGEQFDAV